MVNQKMQFVLRLFAFFALSFNGSTCQKWRKEGLIREIFRSDKFSMKPSTPENFQKPVLCLRGGMNDDDDFDPLVGSNVFKHSALLETMRRDDSQLNKVDKSAREKIVHQFMNRTGLNPAVSRCFTMAATSQ
jgi:hypothetical protein